MGKGPGFTKLYGHPRILQKLSGELMRQPTTQTSPHKRQVMGSVDAVTLELIDTCFAVSNVDERNTSMMPNQL